MAGSDQRAMEEDWQVGKKRPGAGRIRRRRKGFGYRVSQGAGPGNTNARELLSNEVYIEAVLHFLRDKSGRGEEWGRQDG